MKTDSRGKYIRTDEMRRNISRAAKGRKLSKETRKKISEGLTGRMLSEQHKRKGSIAKMGEKNPMYGRDFSKEHRKRLAEATSVKWEDEDYKKKLSEAHKGQKAWNKGKKSTVKIWNKGLKGIHLSSSSEWKKGCIPWNKGKKLSEQHRKNLSLSHIGNKPTKEAIKKMVDKTKGVNHWNWKGGKVGYDALHTWLVREFGKAYKCEMKGCIYPRNNARGELMKNPKRYEWANITGKYLRKRKDWMMMCPSCHRKYDLNNKIKRIM